MDMIKKLGQQKYMLIRDYRVEIKNALFLMMRNGIFLEKCQIGSFLSDKFV